MSTDEAGQGLGEAWQILRGSLVNVSGFVLRAGGRVPFIFLAAMLYGAEAVGRFAAVAVVIQVAAALAVFGMRRSLYELLNRSAPEDGARILFSGLALALSIAAALAAGIAAFAENLFQDSPLAAAGIWIVLLIPVIAASEVLLVGSRYHNVMRYHVAARSVAEPWMLSLLSAGMAYVLPDENGLLVAYAGANVSAFLVAATGFRRCVLAGRHGPVLPQWHLMASIVRHSSPTAVVDFVEYLLRRLDILLLSLFVSDAVVGAYYIARQIALLVQNVKTAFEPILEPVIARLTVKRGVEEAAHQLRLVSRWIFTIQLALLVAIGLSAGALLEILGEGFTDSATILVLLLAAELIGGSAAPWELAILYTRRHLNLLCSVAGIAVYTLSCLLLARLFGGVGAGVAFLAGLTVLAGLRLWIARAVLGLDIFERSMLKPVAAGGAALGAGYVASVLSAGLPPVWIVAGVIGVSLAAYAAVLILAGFETTDRTLFRKIVRRS